jgi:hypothetical protein
MMLAKVLLSGKAMGKGHLAALDAVTVQVVLMWASPVNVPLRGAWQR